MLNPIRLTQPALPAIDYTKPFTLTFTFTATAAVRGSRSYTLANATEQTGATFRYTLVQVPEPSVTVMVDGPRDGFAASVMTWPARTRTVSALAGTAHAANAARTKAVVRFIGSSCCDPDGTANRWAQAGKERARQS